MKKLYLCRHGETEWSLTGRHTGTTDIPLTQKGKVQAKELHEKLKELSFSSVFTSPLKRAKETCLYNKRVEEPLLSEWDYGDYEGKTAEAIREKNPSWNLFMKGAPNGESLENVSQRADAFLKNVEGLEGNVLAFSHGHFIRVIALRYLGLDLFLGNHFLLSTGSVSILSRYHEDPAIELWNG